MRYFLSFIGIIGSLAMMKYREQVGSLFGQPAWADKVGGIYNVVVIMALVLFFWSVAALTNTEEFLFRPLLWILPGAGNQPTNDPFAL